MLTELYIEALLVDEELADQIWEAWNAGKADDQTACLAWLLIGGLTVGLQLQPVAIFTRVITGHQIRIEGDQQI